MRIQSGLKDILTALAQHDLWLFLGWCDVRQRYRRSVLGPLWMTLSTGLLVATLGLLWSTLFKLNVRDYLPFFAVGNIVWGFIALQLNEAGTCFTQFGYIITQTRLPLAVYVLRQLFRNLIIFAHNAVIILAVLLWVGPGLSWGALAALPGLLALTVWLFSVSLILAILCTRFRDAQPIVANLVTIAFFLTPIVWTPQTLGPAHQWIAQYNPLYHILHLIRAPLLGTEVPWPSWAWAAGSIALCGGLGVALLHRFRTRIVYWL